jgi:N-acetylglucosaminyldiphosphoundecaprenol N-acetyl-beta-D-mannosaminyltransferase
VDRESDPLTAPIRTSGLHPRPSTVGRTDVVARPATVDLLGIPVSVIDYEQALAWIEDAVAARQRSFICVSNVHAVMAAAEDPGLNEALLQSSINVPDGMPLVWAMNLLGESLRTRVYGPELMARACARAARSGERFYLYGGRNQGALVQLALNLRQRYPGIKIVGGYSPPHRPLSGDERA